MQCGLKIASFPFLLSPSPRLTEIHFTLNTTNEHFHGISPIPTEPSASKANLVPCPRQQPNPVFFYTPFCHSGNKNLQKLIHILLTESAIKRMQRPGLLFRGSLFSL